MLAVDRDLVIKSAQWAIDSGAKLVSIVSALGASEKSLSFYSRVKGQMEAEAKSLGVHSLHLWQPSVLLGERDENRFTEEIGVNYLVCFQPAVYHPGQVKR